MLRELEKTSVKNMIEVQALIFGSLLWASIQDFKTHRVSDLVWIAGGGPALIVSLFLYGFPSLLGMMFQGLILFFLGYGLHYFSSFGMADVIALGFIGFSLPGPRPLTLAGAVLGTSVLYQKAFYRFTGQKAVPLLPGILIGYTFFLVFLFL